MTFTFCPQAIILDLTAHQFSQHMAALSDSYARTKRSELRKKMEISAACIFQGRQLFDVLSPPPPPAPAIKPSLTYIGSCMEANPSCSTILHARVLMGSGKVLPNTYGWLTGAVQGGQSQSYTCTSTRTLISGFKSQVGSSGVGRIPG